MGKKKVVIAGFGDTGLLVATQLAGQGFDVVGITPKPCHHSQQELGGRLAQPALWQELYFTGFESYKKLDAVRIVQGYVTSIDLEKQLVQTTVARDGSHKEEAYDVLLIASGVTNGFWRTTKAETKQGIQQTIQQQHEQIVNANHIAVVGAGPSGVSAAYNVAQSFPGKKVDLFCSRDSVLPGYHPRVCATVQSKLQTAGVKLHFNHRAKLPSDCDKGFTVDAINFETPKGQADFKAELVVWTVGKVSPNNVFIPKSLLNEEGFVICDPYFRAGGHKNVFAIGDIAQTDALRTSARNDGWQLVATNMSAFLNGQDDGAMGKYHPEEYKWGSILGVWEGEGMELFMKNGWLIWIPQSFWALMWPLVQMFLWGGMRNTVNWNAVVLPAAKRRSRATGSVIFFIVMVFMIRVCFLLSQQGYHRILTSMYELVVPK